MDISTLKLHYKDRLKIKKPNPVVDGLLSVETRTFLQTVGLPEDEELGLFFDENMSLLTDDLVRLEFFRTKPLCLNLRQGEGVYSGTASEDFVNSSIQQFVACVYEFEVYYSTIAAKQVFGQFYGETNGKPNRLAYAAYLTDKVKAIDPAVFKKGYYWPAFLEQMEYGGI